MTNKATRLLSLVRLADPDQSRGSVLDGALAVFLDIGIRRASMSDIARLSGISPATLYRRFASKSDVIREVGLREVRRFIAEADDALAELRAQGADAETQVTELGLAVIDGIRRNDLLKRLLRTEPELVLPFLTIDAGPVIALGRDYVTEVLTRLQAEGQLPQIDVAPLAEVTARMAISLALTPESVLPLDDPEAARALIRTFLVNPLSSAG